MNYRNVRDFAKGLITTRGRGKAPIDSLLVAENIRIDNGVAKPRAGQDYLSVDEVIDTDIEILYEYTREYHDGTSAQFYRDFVFSSGTELWSWGEGNAWVFEINDGFPLASSDIWMAEYMDWAYIGDGINKLYKYNGVSYFVVGIVAPAAPADFVDVMAGAESDSTFDGYRAYKYRYVRKVNDGSGNQIDYIASSYSNITYSDKGMGRQFVLSLLASADPQVTHIELYGTEMSNQPITQDDNPTFYLFATLSNANQDYNDNISDESILSAPGGVNVYTPEDTTQDWTAPPAGTSMLLYYKDRLYGVNVKDDPSVLRYSRLGEPEQWGANGFLDVRKDDGDVITGLAVRGNSLFIFKNRSIFVITGDPDAVPMMELVAGGEVTGTPTEFGLGCTASRSLASFGDDTLIFYNSVHGVYKIKGGSVFPISQYVQGIKGLSDDCAGAVYVDENENAYYVLSQPSGNSFVCHLDTNVWVQDTNVNVDAFCVDAQGRLLGVSGGYINHFYDDAETTDNGTAFTCKLRTTWVNLRQGVMHAVIRGILLTTDALTTCTLYLYNQDGLKETKAVTSVGEPVGIDGISGRLFSVLLEWTTGTLESLTFLFLRRRGH
jgi:hypothetical protein